MEEAATWTSYHFKVSLISMEEQFNGFLSDNLLEFCSYDSHKNNLTPIASSCNELHAALTMLTKQEVENTLHSTAKTTAALTTRAT